MVLKRIALAAGGGERAGHRVRIHEQRHRRADRQRDVGPDLRGRERQRRRRSSALAAILAA